MSEGLRERIARATWEQWRTMEISAESCRDLSFDELVELAKAPPLERAGRNPAAMILEAGLAQADAALAAIEASGTHVVVHAADVTGEQFLAATQAYEREGPAGPYSPMALRSAYRAMLAARPRLMPSLTPLPPSPRNDRSAS